MSKCLRCYSQRIFESFRILTYLRTKFRLRDLVLYQPPNSSEEQQSTDAPNFTISTFCPYAEKNGLCEALDAGRFCPYLHGDTCDFCNLPVLDPTDDRQREEHRLVRSFLKNRMQSLSISFE